MNMKLIALTVGLFAFALALAPLPAFAHCGHCGVGDKKGDAACPTGACDPKAPVDAKAAAALPTLSPLGLKALLDSGVKIAIFDARSGQYDDGERVAGAGSLNAESKAEAIAQAIPDKKQLVVTYCANLQCPASGLLAAHLRKSGYANVIEMPEGIAGWKAAGLPVDKAK